MNTAAPISEMSDQERELHIQHCGYLMEQSMLAGNRQEALDWMQAEMLAISQRSPDQLARMEAEIERAIDDGVNYFAACGARDGATLNEIEATK